MLKNKPWKNRKIVIKIKVLFTFIFFNFKSKIGKLIPKIKYNNFQSIMKLKKNASEKIAKTLLYNKYLSMLFIYYYKYVLKSSVCKVI